MPSVKPEVLDAIERRLQFIETKLVMLAERYTPDEREELRLQIDEIREELPVAN